MFTKWHGNSGGWKDNKGRIWFCGRKSHRVITAKETLYTIPCEAIFNVHPAVFRSALVGIGTPPDQKPVICIETEPNLKPDQRILENELSALAAKNNITKHIQNILFHPSFPVDIRHNSKIFREKLAIWAENELSKR